MDEILTGAIRTYGADSVITDSAPGATAYATGFKGSDKGISVGPWSVTLDAVKADPAMKYVPLATLLEGAKLTGRATGVIATSNVQHATPAAFTSHWHDRGNYLEIGEQQVYNGVDVVLSGGGQYLLPKEAKGGKREDKENLVDVIQSKGYAYVTTKDAMDSIRSGRIWGAFAPDAMAYDMDRADLAKTEPALAEMTTKAIELLSTAPPAGRMASSSSWKAPRSTGPPMPTIPQASCPTSSPSTRPWASPWTSPSRTRTRLWWWSPTMAPAA